MLLVCAVKYGYESAFCPSSMFEDIPAYSVARPLLKATHRKD